MRSSAPSAVLSFPHFVIRIIIPVIVFVFLVSPPTTSAQAKMRVAVLDFSANNVSKFAAKAVSEILSTEIAKKGDLIVIERSQMGAIMQEQGFQLTGCTDSSCAVQVGRILSANKILIGTLSKLGNVFSMTARVVNVETGRIDFAESERCNSEDDIEKASRVLAIRLLNRITGKKYSLPKRTYETEEERNRFAISGGFRYGWINGVKLPLLKKTDVVTKETNATAKVVVITPSYELSEHFTIKSNLKYYKIDTENYEGYIDTTGISGAANSLYYTYYQNSIKSFKINGYGFTLNLQYSYPIGGFIPFATAGFGFSRFELEDAIVNDDFHYSVRHNDGTGMPDADIYENYEIAASKNFDAWIGEIELGISIYVSKYVELVLSAGVEIPVASKLINDIEIRQTYRDTYGDLLLIPDEDETIEDELDTSDFEGNFPPIYFVQAAVNFRIF